MAVPQSPQARPRQDRIASIDALRGLVMFAMIFVNDIAGVSREVVPGWMRHFPEDGNGMTFVDLVFPAFLFIVGMSVPFALGPRLDRGEPVGRVLLHVLTRTLALLAVGILMVNDESPAPAEPGWSPPLWAGAMYLAAILAFCAVGPRGAGEPSRAWRAVTRSLRLLGLAALVALAFAFRGEHGQRIITLAPFAVRTEWYGILGLIGWAYLVAALVFLVFRGHRTALLGCTALLFCLYPADRTGTFRGFWLADLVGIGETLGSQAAVATAGLLLASALRAPDTAPAGARTRFKLLFVAGCAAAALLLHGLYGINKNAATPSWCLWACAVTAALWLLIDRAGPFLTRPLAAAGQNVLLAYLLHNLLYPALDLLGLDGWYARLAQPDLAHAVARSVGCAVAVLAVTTGLNRLGFRLRL
jgi:predicted acyltransferase